MSQIFLTVFCTLLIVGCATAPAIIVYERTEFGLPVACVEGEESCRELSQDEQRELIDDILETYECEL